MALTWTFHSDGAGYKTVKATLSNYVVSSQSVVKYNGKILKVVTSSIDGADQSRLWAADNGLLITIADTDSGWGESYTPTADEIKAYFMGWKMFDASTNPDGSGTYNGTGTKNWAYRSNGVNGDAGYAGGTATLPTTIAPIFTPYHLTYQLATPQTIELVEGVDYFGSVSLHEGDNLVELGEAVVVREPVTPVINNSNSKYYAINVYNSANYSTNSELDYRTSKLLKIYKNEVDDTHNWIVTTSSNDINGVYGKSWAYIYEKYDPTAQYYVTYIAQSYQISAHADEAEVEYATNLRSVVARNVQDIADTKQDVSDLAWGKANKFQERWIAPTLLSGWVNYGGLNELIGYYKDEFGNVHLKGTFKSGAVGSSAPAFYLPKGYRPSKYKYFRVSSENPIGTYIDGRLVLTPEGAVYFINSGNAFVDIGEISFRAEQ